MNREHPRFNYGMMRNLRIPMPRYIFFTKTNHR
jgi:hypothetical protein